MVGRPLMLASLLGASVGVPYVVSNTTQGPSTGAAVAGAAAPAAQKSSWPSFSFGGSGANAPTAPPLAGNHQYPMTNYPSTTYIAAAANPPVEPVHYHTIQQVFRFDVTKEWVYQNFDRKSTGLGDPGMFGVRVALVTGTQMTDLAGALTYYFDGQGQVQHISFRGRTADTTPLVQFLAQTYRFQRMEAPPGEQLFQVREGSSVFSEMRTRPESVLLETTPHGSFGVVVELGRPGSNRVLTPPAPQLQIPEVASPPPHPEAAARTGAEAAAEGAEAEPGLIGDIRPPTEVEHGQLRAHRWPN